MPRPEIAALSRSGFSFIVAINALALRACDHRPGNSDQ
jgi:hypothetical protein